ncbi:MAG: hypothetical protein E7511_05300 [Ruminococcus sp.]|nr:hypothetical protein [Ruminococcus sp.]
MLGLIPGIGIAFDIVNAIWYFAEGDIFGGICSLIGILPFVGDAIGLMGKAGSWACKVAKFVNTATYAVSMLKSTYVIGNVIKDNIERYLINGEEFSLAGQEPLYCSKKTRESISKYNYNPK